MDFDFVSVACEAAHRGGRVLKDWIARFTVREKGPANLVTEADFASQSAIHDFLSEHFPEHGFLGEEGLSEPSGHSEFRWIIDPLDGTSNYVHGFPYYAVSIALEHRGTLVAGVVYDPNREETFAAARGQGATLDGRPIHTSTVSDASQALAVASLPVDVQAGDPPAQRFLRALGRLQTVQRTGSAALNLAYVASGRVDVFWSTSLKPWDMAAGVLIVEEAGGRVSRIDGGPFDVMQANLLASNGTALHEQLVQLFA